MMGLKEIDALIARNEYNAALKSLAEYQKEHPEDFDAAQKRINRIMKERFKFNQQARSLVDRIGEIVATAAEADENDIEKVQIIGEMEKGEVNRSAESIALTNDARRTLTLQYYITRADDSIWEGLRLATEGRADLESEEAAKKYAEAASVLSRCLTLKTAESDVVYDGEYAVPVSYDNELKSSVAESVSAVIGHVASLSDLLAACQRETAALCRACASLAPEQALSQFASLEAAFRNLAAVRNDFVRLSTVLAECDEAVLEQYPSLVSSYISFARLALEGYDDVAGTGIIACVDSFWNSRVEYMKRTLYETVLQLFSDAETAVPASALLTLFSSPLAPAADAEYAVAAAPASADRAVPAPEGAFSAPVMASFSSAVSFAGLARNVHNLYRLAEHHPAAAFTEYTASMDFIHGFLGDAFLAAAGRVNAVAARMSETGDAMTGGAEQSYAKTGGAGTGVSEAAFSNVSAEDQAVFLEQLHFYRQILSDTRSAKTASRLEAEISREGAVIQKNEDELLPEDTALNWQSGIAYYQDIRRRTEDVCMRKLTEHWLSLAQGYASGSDTSVASLFAQVEESEKTAGIRPSEPEDADSYVQTRYYPSRAYRELSQASRTAAALKKELLSESEALSSPDVTADAQARIAAYRDTVVKNAQLLDSLLERSALSMEEASERAQNAKIAAQQGDECIRQVKAAVGQSQFDAAINYLGRARDSYSLSLSLEYDEALQSRTDTELFSLDSDITFRQHLAIVMLVRTLKNQAREAFYAQDFTTAENRIVNAREQWAKTSDEEDAEIQDLFNMINTALSMSSERSISVSAPQYSEMSSLLSLAHIEYTDGEALIASGDKKAAENAFFRATEQLRKVQRVYPLNQEANLLSLRIEQQLHPEDFGKRFEAMVKKARSDKDKRSAYATLTDLYALNPAYPGLAKIIEDLEYDIGIRVRPVTAANRKKAATLVSQAAKDYKTANGDIEKLKKVLSTVNSVLETDRNNEEAMALKDSVQTAMGPQVTNVLSAEDESVYLVAIQELNKNNIIRSYAMIEQLIQKGSNRTNRKLQQLMKRIRALM
ncbi:MAG: hypothetical protein K6G80_07055 [Treponema sp.]|nr:hypothetical protein [Treponema sp.]